MADEAQRNLVKVGVHLGSGPPPGYQWNVDILNRCYDEAMRFLDDDQYEHLARQVKELAIRPVEEIYEIRDKGGILERLSVRIFYTIHKTSRTIIVIGAIKKQNDGPTPMGDKVTMRRRARLCLELYNPEL